MPRFQGPGGRGRAPGRHPHVSVPELGGIAGASKRPAAADMPLLTHDRRKRSHLTRICPTFAAAPTPLRTRVRLRTVRRTSKSGLARRRAAAEAWDACTTMTTPT